MKSTAGRLAVAAALSPVVMLSMAGCSHASPSSKADSLPYQDTSAVGSLTLCSATGQALTAGSTAGAMWIASVHSSLAAPSYLAGTGRSASLEAAQPRAGVDPGDWSSMALTGSTRYTDPANPTAVTASTDSGLDQFITAFPPQEDGLVELRLYLSAPNQEADTDTYAAVNLRISSDGKTWTAVDPGSVPCSTGSGTSVATLLHLKPVDPASGTGATSPGSSDKGTPTRSGAATPTAPGQSDASLAPGAIGASASSGGQTPPPAGDSASASSPAAPGGAAGGGSGGSATGGSPTGTGGSVASQVSTDARTGHLRLIEWLVLAGLTILAAAVFSLFRRHRVTEA